MKMKRTLNWQRFWLAFLSVAGLVAIGVGLFWTVIVTHVEISTFVASAIVLLIRELGGGKAVAFGWFYDGSADKPPPDPGTSTTTSAIAVAPLKTLPGATPAGTASDPLATHEVPTPPAA